MSVFIARACTAMYSTLFPCLITSVKSKVKWCFLTSKSQISIQSTGKMTLKLQKTVTSSWTYFSRQFNSSSSTSTNCAQGRDVMNNWRGVVESCSEGEQALEHRKIVHLFSFHPLTPQHNQFSSVSLDQEWSWHITQGRVQTFSTVTQLRSCIWFHQPHPSELQWWPQKTAEQGSITLHGVRVRDKHSTGATGNNKKSPLLTFSIFLVLEHRSVLFLPPGCSWSHWWVISSCPFIRISLPCPVQGSDRVALVVTWNPTQVNPPHPQPHLSQQSICGQHKVGMASPHHQTQLWAAQAGPRLPDFQAQAHRGDYN